MENGMDNWEALATGESGDIELEKAWLRMASTIFKVFCDKQHDYGHKNIAIGGLRGVILRSGDKMARLWELTGLADSSCVERDPVVGDEDLFQNLLDWADYGIIAMMVERDLWPKCSVDEAFGRLAVLRVAQEILAQKKPTCSSCDGHTCQVCE
jgi:hypothetical protein